MADIRSKSVDFLGDSIAAATGADASTLAAQLEQAVFEKHGQSTSNNYRSEIRSLGLTLKKDNPQLAQDLAAGTVAPEQLVNMSLEVSIKQTPSVVFSEAWLCWQCPLTKPILRISISTHILRCTTGYEDRATSQTG